MKNKVLLFLSALFSASSIIESLQVTQDPVICQAISVPVPEIVNERNFECSANFINPRFAWQLDDADDDGYRVQLFDGSKNLLYQTDELSTSSSNSENEVTVHTQDRYQVRLTCENAFFNCRGITFSYAILDCGCSGELEQIEACITTGTITTMRSAVCATPSPPSISTEPVEGQWEQIASGPGVAYETSITYSTEQGSKMTDTQKREFSAKVSGGFKYLAVSGALEVGSQLTEAASQSISTTFNQESSTTISIDCPDISSSTTGQWFVWVWQMRVEQDNSGGVGATVSTNNYVCTSSFPEEPRCPLGYCANLLCQTCLTPFDELSVRNGVDPTPTQVICQAISVPVPEIVNERNFECSANFINPRFAWQLDDADDDRYRVQLFDGSKNLLYQTDELSTSSSNSENEVTVHTQDRYQVRLTCENAFFNCREITFSYAILDCGCSGELEQIEACITTGTITTMRSAVCATPSPPDPTGQPSSKAHALSQGLSFCTLLIGFTVVRMW